MGKIKLSDTFKFFTSRLNRLAGAHVEMSVELTADTVVPGATLEGQVRLVATNRRHRTLDRLTFSLRGHVQRDGRWQDYEQSVEVAHDTALPAEHQYIIPVVINVPLDAVLTEDGANWRLRAQAVIDRTIDPRAEAHFTVISSKTAAPPPGR